MHFRISSSLSFQRKTRRYVFLLLFVLTPVHLNWPSYATGKCYRSPRQLISTMKHWRLYITIHSLTIFKWKTRNLRLNLIYLSFFVQYISKYILDVYIHNSLSLYCNEDACRIFQSLMAYIIVEFLGSIRQQRLARAFSTYPLKLQLYFEETLLEART